MSLMSDLEYCRVESALILKWTLINRSLYGWIDISTSNVGKDLHPKSHVILRRSPLCLWSRTAIESLLELALERRTSSPVQNIFTDKNLKF